MPRWTIQFPRDKTISVHNWTLLARALHIPKTSKRIQKKMLKKRILEWLLAGHPDGKVA